MQPIKNDDMWKNSTLCRPVSTLVGYGVNKQSAGYECFKIKYDVWHVICPLSCY